MGQVCQATDTKLSRQVGSVSKDSSRMWPRQEEVYGSFR